MKKKEKKNGGLKNMTNKCKNCNRPLYILCGDCLDKDLQRLNTLIENIFDEQIRYLRTIIEHTRHKYSCIIKQEEKRINGRKKCYNK